MYTCISCKVIFASADLQREHYKSEWHRYNLKRKVAQLPPVTKEDFDKRAAAHSQVLSVEKEEIPTKCQLCHKTFVSKNSLSNHLKSKKHLEAIQLGNIIKTPSVKPKPISFNHPLPAPVKIEEPKVEIENLSDAEEWEDEENDSDWESCDEEDDTADTSIPPNFCLFCSYESPTFEDNVKHMTDEHSFFLPDIEYLVDLKGFITFLGYKVGNGHICLWCDSKAYRSIRSVQQHMLDKGHCKLKHEGEALLSYGEFYDYSSTYPDDADDEDMSIPFEADDYELVLPSGATIGHRSLAIFYKQNLKPVKVEQSKSMKKLMQHYRALGWTGTTGEIAVRKAKDLNFMRKLQSKQSLKLSLKANKFQPHLRPQVMF